ncbi:hypothetical protein H2198_010580 [Neophaeococcomyces mojaviensis]|uniref:Uncharacterized protein n=1 Tax=Neophaeococcomyces mojaviensis TaxID=3383035 RepID=A0ACC2ZRA2_9EURO|nr:hypothetical protein H2198_010580 [Knufia sp. JES_112]
MSLETPQKNERTSLLPQVLLDPSQAPDTTENLHFRAIDPRQFRWLLTCVICAYTLAFFDSTLMASSHPVITSYFHASNAASWMSTVFYLTSTVSQPLYGRISDVIGRRPVYLFAIAMFGLATGWCALAPTVGSFIAARAFCGFGAGGVIAMSGILISDVVKLEFRGIYQSYLNGSYGFGCGLGAALGGLLCDRLGWRAAFGIQIPFIAAFMVLALFSTPSHLGPNLAQSQGVGMSGAFRSFDYLGAVVLTITVTSCIMGINLGGNVFPWTHPIVLISLLLFVIAAIVLVVVEKRATRPMLPLPLLSTFPNGNLMWSNFFLTILTAAVMFNVPLFLQAVKQMTPTASGLFMISPLVGVSIFSVISGFFINKTREMKPMMVMGVLASLVGVTTSTLLAPNTPEWALVLLIPWASIGQGFMFPSTTVAALAVNDQGEQAMVITTLNLVRNLGAIMGVATSSWILQTSLPIYLQNMVSGDDSVKREIIDHVRKSVAAIAGLSNEHKWEVIAAYSKALRTSFAFAFIFAGIAAFLVLPMKIPRLPRTGDEPPKVECRGRSNSIVGVDHC